MSRREAILSKIRTAVGSASLEGRRKKVSVRLSQAPRGVIPARGQLDAAKRVDLFADRAASVSATVERVASIDGVPDAVTAYLRARNLSASLRMGDDRRLSSMPWPKALERKYGASDGNDQIGLSHADAGVAETGTVLLQSGKANPSTVNFLPDHHIVVIDAKDIDGDLETALARLRSSHGDEGLPRTVNMITGPSRSGDIEQKLILGAHGPRALHLIVVDGAA